jgi:hypothetical protein
MDLSVGTWVAVIVLRSLVVVGWYDDHDEPGRFTSPKDPLKAPDAAHWLLGGRVAPRTFPDTALACGRAKGQVSVVDDGTHVMLLEAASRLTVAAALAS